MSEQIEITDAKGEVRRVAMTGDTATVGSGSSASIQCTGRGIAPLHLRFVRIARGVRVESAQAGGTVEVNGEELFCKDLTPDDVVAIGELEVRWIPDRAPPPSPAHTARRSGPRAAVRSAASPVSRARSRSRGAPTWLMASGVLLVLVVGAVLVLKGLSRSTWPHSPSDYVDLAREQLANSHPQRALDTLEIALKDAEGATRQQALTLQADIRRLLVERVELPKVQAARQEHDLLASFEGRYLQTVERPAAREFVRLCDQWLAEHGDVCRRLAEGQPLLRSVEERRQRHLAAAALGEPETAADVIFAAQSLLRFQWRDYRGAMARLDAFLSRQPDAAVQAERARMLEEGEQWLQGKLRNIDSLLSRGDRDNAAKDLEQMEKWSTLPEWAAQVQERRSRL